jgi:hypothetical protein
MPPHDGVRLHEHQRRARELDGRDSEGQLRPDAAAIYGAIDMPWAKLVGQIAQAYSR